MNRFDKNLHLSLADVVDERISRIENNLVCLSANGQPQWGNISTLEERMGYYQVPGVSIAVLYIYKLDWAKGYGMCSVSEGKIVTVRTLFPAASVSKSVSAAVTLRLVEQGRLNLDENVNDNLVSWRVPENEYTKIEKVTLRRLLSHSAGLVVGLSNRGPDDPMPAYISFGSDVPSITIPRLLEGIPEDDITPAQVVFRYLGPIIVMPMLTMRSWN